MRRKRTRAQAALAPTLDDEHPPDATGLTIDWIGVQATGGGGGGMLPVWLVGGLAAIRRPVRRLESDAATGGVPAVEALVTAVEALVAPGRATTGGFLRPATVPGSGAWTTGPPRRRG